MVSKPVPRAAAEAISTRHPQLEGRKGKIRLDLNENTTGPSPRVLEALSNLSPYDISSYPESADSYAKLARQFHLKEGQILVTNGGEESIRLVLDAFVDAGQEAILPVPTFSMFSFYLELAGVTVREVPYKEGFSFPLAEVLAAIKPEVRVIFLSTPNHTTGTAIPLDEIREVLEVAGKHGTVVLVDEAYYDFHGQTSLPWLDEFPNLVVVRTFSKAYGLGGLRAGLMFACSETMASLQKVKSPYSVNRAAIVSIQAALSDQVYINRHVQSVLDQRRELERFLAEDLKLTVHPSAANFLVVKLGDKAQELRESLAAEGILVRDLSDRPQLEGCLRVGVGTAGEMATLVAVLRRLYELPAADTETAESPLELQTVERASHALRKFPEGELALSLKLDGTGSGRVVVGSEPLARALAAFAAQAHIDLELEVQGEVPTKHLGLILGQAVSEAVGNRARIEAVGCFAFPVGAALALCALDFGGDARLACDLSWEEAEPALDAVRALLEGFSAGAKATLHIRMLSPGPSGESCSAVFSALGRALGLAKLPVGAAALG